MMKPSRVAAIVFALIVLIDVTLIILHGLYGWSVINLDEEGNLSAWYSSTKLSALAVMCAFLWRQERRQQRRKLTFLWLIVALLFLGLSIDESASLHERLARVIMQESSIGLDIRETALQGNGTKDSFAWIIILSPFILATVVFFAVFFYSRLFRARAGYLAGLAGLLLFITAIAMEATIYFTPAMHEWEEHHLTRYEYRILIEEAAEVLGSTFFLLAFYRYKRRLDEQAEAGAPHGEVT